MDFKSISKVKIINIMYNHYQDQEYQHGRTVHIQHSFFNFFFSSPCHIQSIQCWRDLTVSNALKLSANFLTASTLNFLHPKYLFEPRRIHASTLFRLFFIEWQLLHEHTQRIPYGLQAEHLRFQFPSCAVVQWWEFNFTLRVCKDWWWTLPYFTLAFLIFTTRVSRVW